jgi:hypothetical protein
VHHITISVSNQLDTTLLSFIILAALHVSGVLCPSSGVYFTAWAAVGFNK